MSIVSNYRFGKKEETRMKNKLPKLEVHFGNEVLSVPQTVKLNLVMFAYYKDTLKENILESYKHRTGVVMRENGLRPTEITLEESESQLVKDLKEFGNDFVLEQVYLDCNIKVTYDTLSTPVDWLGDEEEIFERKVEEFEMEEMDK